MTSAAHEAWLNRTVEEPLDPSLPICDTHHHLWYNTDNEYRVEDILKDAAGGHRIVATVFVESRLMQDTSLAPELRPAGETNFVMQVTNCDWQLPGTPAVAAGIVGFADLMLGDEVAAVLEAHAASCGNRFKGIRYTTAWDAAPELKSRWEVSPGLLMDTAFRRGFAVLGRYNLSFDSWLFHPQLGELADLARSYPDIPVIVDHLGGPLAVGPYAGRDEEVFREWRQSLDKLAACPNVYMKIGGFGMRIFGRGWNEGPVPPGSVEIAGACRPYFMECIERFGVHRCMFESNFPVDRAAYSYTVLWNAFKRLTADFSEDERNALFYGTAARVYRLAP